MTVPLHADQRLIPLGQLIGRSEVIVIGSVTETRDAGGGAYLMTVAVEQTLKGTPPEKVEIFASSVDPTFIRPLSAGVRILTFLEPRTLQPVAGEHGVLVLGSDDSVRVASAIVKTAMEEGTRLQLRDVSPYFGSGTTPPPVLIGSLLEELSLHVTPSADGDQLARFACDGSVLPAVQLWAIERSGRLKIAAARPCLESLTGDPSNRATRIVATNALGDLKMAESVPVLLKLIEPLPGQIIDPSGDEEPADIRPANDPEDDSSPVSDPAEERHGTAAGREPAAAPSTLPDGDVEPDGAPSDDAVSRGADAGLSDAAVLALGKIGDPAAVRDLSRVVGEGDDLSLHSTVVVALGLIGGESVLEPLTTISKSHPNELVRELASQTLARLQTKQ
jgi:hypothetical protein